MAKLGAAARGWAEDTMESVSRKKSTDQAQMGAPRGTVAELPEAEPMFDLIELMFFAYRDFVGDADRILERLRFGRAHHRVLHFVNRQPGLTIAELLDILKITKQSLSRVLKDLVDTDHIEVAAGTLDRRQRLLYPT